MTMTGIHRRCEVVAIQYNEVRVRNVIDDYGMIVDEVPFNELKSYCASQGFTQNQFESLMFLHIEAVARLYDRRLFGWRWRLGMVLYWLGFGKEIG